MVSEIKSIGCETELSVKYMWRGEQERVRCDMQSETTGMEPHTTDDESTTNNRWRCGAGAGAGAEADGGVRWFDLTGFERDLIVEIYQMDQPSGQVIRRRIEAEHGEDVTSTRLYSNLDDLVDYGLIDKGQHDLRTNCYEVTNDGRRLVEETAQSFASATKGGTRTSDSNQTHRVLDPADLHLWQTYDHVVDGDDCR